jgi:hypothetical protein
MSGVCDAFSLFLMIFVAEEQGTIDIQFPSYVTRRGETDSKISEAEISEAEISEAEKQAVV